MQVCRLATPGGAVDVVNTHLLSDYSGSPGVAPADGYHALRVQQVLPFRLLPPLLSLLRRAHLPSRYPPFGLLSSRANRTSPPSRFPGAHSRNVVLGL